jgi:hypothetical protein
LGAVRPANCAAISSGVSVVDAKLVQLTHVLFAVVALETIINATFGEKRTGLHLESLEYFFFILIE